MQIPQENKHLLLKLFGILWVQLEKRKLPKTNFFVFSSSLRLGGKGDFTDRNLTKTRLQATKLVWGTTSTLLWLIRSGSFKTPFGQRPPRSVSVPLSFHPSCVILPRHRPWPHIRFHFPFMTAGSREKETIRVREWLHPKIKFQIKIGQTKKPVLFFRLLGFV